MKNTQKLVRSYLLSLCGSLALTTIGHSAGRPNVLMIVVDDLKPTIHAYGDDYALTPAMDALASRGTIFTNAHCQQAICGPTRASLLTGLRPDTVKVWDLWTPMREQVPDLVTLPQYFKQQGYHTASIGKVFHSTCCDGRNTQDVASWSQPHIESDTSGLVYGVYGNPAVKEITREFWAAAQAEAEEKEKKKQSELKPKPTARGAKDSDPMIGEHDLREFMFKPTTECLDHDVPDGFYEDGKSAEIATGLLREFSRRREPFFLAVGFKRPHLPFVAPKRYWDLYDPQTLPLATVQEMPHGAPWYAFQDSWELRHGYAPIPEGRFPEEMQRRLLHGYYACVSYVDAQIGKLVEALRENGLADNTVIVIWGDHGWHLGDHGMWSKQTNYEQATRAPLMVIDLRRPDSARQVARPVEFLDVAPTLAELAGLPVPSFFEGRSLAPLLSHPQARHKCFAVSQFPRNNRPGADESLIGNAFLGKVMGYAFRDERYRFVVWIEKDWRSGARDGVCVGTELYDYLVDPLETRNLAADPAYAVLVRGIEQDAAAFADRELRIHWTHSN